MNDGFTIGAHSMDHPEFQYIDLNVQLLQAKKSLTYVRDNFNPPTNSFSFPFTDYGVGKEFFAKLQQTGLADLTFGCAGLKRDRAENHLQRIPYEDSSFSVKQTLAFEYLYYILKSFVGRNTIKRT